MKLNYKKMIEDINKIIDKNIDFLEEMFSLQSGNELREFWIEESLKMAGILAQIYKISHCTTCTACNSKYKVNK